jgi:hypothetical protein
LRVDLHAHSRHSGGGHFDIAGPPTGYASVEAIYRAAKRRGMDLVTLTDLDTIAGCLEFLDRRPDVSDFFISEEVTAMEPQSGSRLNVLVYDITEEEHEEIRRLRADVAELMSYLNAREIPSAMGLASIDAGADRWVDGEPWTVLQMFERYELRHGLRGWSRGERLMRLLGEAAPWRSFGAIGGSGSYGPAGVGRTFTSSPARTRTEFLVDLRAKRTWAAGSAGSEWKGAGEQMRLIGHGYLALLAPGPASGNCSNGRRLGRALAALPVHLSGLSLCGHGLRAARASARLRRARRHLDRITVERFQQKARSYGRATAVAGDVESAHG